MTKHTITIHNSSSFKRNVIRLLAVINGVLAPIGVGVLVDSVTMQWAGFILGLLIVGGIAQATIDPNQFATVDEAKARLDEMKAKGEAP
jgi:uncharacterized membrane protein